MKTKKFLSLLITMMMCLSMFAFPVSATETALTLSNYNVTTSGVYLTFSEAVTSYSISVEDFSKKSYGAVTASENQTASVELKLTEKLSLDSEYLLNISATGASGSYNAKKVITFNELWSDSFESYSTANDLDSNYTVIKDDAYNQATPSSYTADNQISLEKEADGNQRLKLGFTSMHGLWIKQFAWNHDNMYYTFEADFEVVPTTNLWGIELATRYTSINGNNKDISISRPDLDIFYQKEFITGTTGQVVAPTSELEKGTKFTFGFTSAKQNDTTESFSIYLNGAEKTSATGTINHDAYGIFTILGCVYGSQYYVDNWKMYTATLSDYVGFNLDSYNITTGAVYFDFNKTVASYQMTVKDGDGNVLGETSVSDNATKKATLKLDTKMELSEPYLLTYSFESANGEMISAEKLITFNTLFADNFESYSTANDLDSNYTVVKDDAYNQATPSSYTADNQISLEKEADGNQRLKLGFTSMHGLWIKQFAWNHDNMYYTFEADFEVVPTTNLWGIELATRYTSINGNNKDISISRPDLDIFYQKEVITGTAGQVVAPTSELEKGTKFTFGFTSAKVNDTTDSFSIYLNGAEKTSATGTINHDAYGIFTILGCVYGSQYYVDNWKMYTATLSDYTESDFAIDYYNFTARGIHIGLSAECNTDALPTVVLKDENGNVASTYIEWEDDKKSLSIIPVKDANGNNSYDNLNPLDMGTTYLLEVSNIKEKAGFKTLSLERVFKFKELWSDDFEDYTLENGDVDYDKLIENYDFVGYFNNGEGDNSIKEPPKENITPYYGIEDGWLTLKPGYYAYISKEPFNTNIVLDIDAKRIESSTNGDYGRGLFFKFNANYSDIYERSVHLMHQDWAPGTTEVWNYLGETLDNTGKTEFANKLQDVPYGMTLVKNTVDSTGNGTIGLYENGEKMVYDDDVVGAYIYALTTQYHTNAIDNWRLYTVSEFEIDYEITNATVNGTKLTTNIKLVNYAKDKFTGGEIIIAAYNDKDKLIGITSGEWDGNNVSVSYDITLAGNEAPEYIKAFLWDDLASMASIRPAADYEMK